MKLAAGDIARRSALKAGAGVAMLLGAGFLLAALWTFLARTLGWGPLGASLAIGLLFMIAGFVVLSMAKHVKHPVPSTDELKNEVEARVNLAVTRATDTAEAKVTQFADMAERKVHGIVDAVGEKATGLVGTVETKVQTLARGTGDTVMRATGLSPEFTDRFQGKNARLIPPVIGAFMVGMTLARKFRARDADDDYEDEDYAYDYDEDDVRDRY